MEKQLYTIDRFLKERAPISRAALYALWKRGEGPRKIKVGTRTFITPEDADEWVRQLRNVAAPAAVETREAGTPAAA